MPLDGLWTAVRIFAELQKWINMTKGTSCLDCRWSNRKISYGSLPKLAFNPKTNTTLIKDNCLLLGNDEFTPW